MRILVVEDDAKTSAFLIKGFSEYSISVDVAEDGEKGLRLALREDYDFIILDVMLPKMDGLSVITELRRAKMTPVIILTARDSVPERVKGLQLGADDYLVKPFSFSELTARVSAVLRRGPTLKEEMLRVADLEIDLARQRAKRGGKWLDLTPKEFALLYLLASSSGEVVSKLRIAEHIWNTGFDSFDKLSGIIDVHMARLRAKVDEPFEEKLIHTVRGRGYVLEKR
jgi:two-component system copper resistance phosphate regulon response regulator CusR